MPRFEQTGECMPPGISHPQDVPVPGMHMVHEQSFAERFKAIVQDGLGF